MTDLLRRCLGNLEPSSMTLRRRSDLDAVELLVSTDAGPAFSMIVSPGQSLRLATALADMALDLMEQGEVVRLDRPPNLDGETWSGARP
jgi:hypothetical protein